MMNKSLLALAVLGAFAGAASAQSSVTIYGLVDLGLAKTNGGTATLGAAPTGLNQTSKAYQMISAYTSRLGFRGNEDLGGGLSAQFLIEHRFNPDTGAQNSATLFWNGRSTVSLTSEQAGRVYLGREYTPLFLMSSRVDPFGSNGVGQMYTYQFAGFNAGGDAGGVRTANVAGYTTPVIGGFSATAAVALSEVSQRGREVALAAQYAAGPLFLGGGYERVYKGTSPASARGQGLWLLTGMYDFGFARLTGYYGRSKTPTPTGVTPTSGLGTIPLNGVGLDTNHSAAIGALVPIGPGNLKFIYAKVDPRRADNSRQKIGLGYDYNLSKRTTIYADGGFAKEDRRTDNRTVMLGLRHFF